MSASPVCPYCQTILAPTARVCGQCGALQPAAMTTGVRPGATFELGFARVVVDARIGEGGMGVVFRAWLFEAPRDGRSHDPVLVALKLLRPHARAQQALRVFLRQEGEALRRLSHPNIVRLFTTVETPPEQGNDLGLVIEYVDGETLEMLIARHVARARLAGPGTLPGLPFRRAWYYFQQLLGALAATHALGIVHRDVKPSNVLLRRDGLVKLTDFGIARAAGPTSGDRLPNDLAPGTGPYMSPEQVLSRPLDGRSDLYSAAIVLYEMLAGRPPFRSEDRSEFLIRRDQVEATPLPIRTFVPQTPPIVDSLFARALAKDPAQRFADAIEMGTAFRTALGFPDTPGWQTQAIFAREAAPARAPLEQTAAMRMATLRDFLVQSYQTAKMTAR